MNQERSFPFSKLELSGSGMGLELTPDKRFKIVLEDRSGTVLFTKFLHKEVRRHPLEGLWAGLYGPHGVEFLAVTYVSKEKEIVDPFPMQDHVARPAFPGDYLRGFKVKPSLLLYSFFHFIHLYFFRAAHGRSQYLRG